MQCGCSWVEQLLRGQTRYVSNDVSEAIVAPFDVGTQASVAQSEQADAPSLANLRQTKPPAIVIVYGSPVVAKTDMERV